MATELSRKTTETTRDDKNVSDDTSTKQHPVKNDKSQKCCQPIGNSPQLRALKVVLPKLEAANISPLPGGVGFSVQPLSATINPLNKTHVPGVGNYPARKSKRNTVELTCCLGCTAGVACKRAKSSGAQRGHKYDKNVAKKRKYVKRKHGGAGKHQPGTRSGSRGMLNLSMVHQYRFNPQTPVRGVSSDEEAPAQKTHLPRGMVNGPVFGTTNDISSTSSTVCSTSVASGNSLPMANIGTCPFGGTACLGTVPTQFPNPPAIITNTRVASLQPSHFSLLPPLPLQQPYVTAIPVYASPNLCPFYMPPEGQAVQTGIPIMPGAHNMMQRPPIYSLMQYCSLPVENNCGQVLTDLACGGTNLPCLNSASFELQTQGRNDNVSTCSTSIGHPEDHVATCSTNVGHQEDHDATCSTNVGHQEDHDATCSTNVGHQEDHDAACSASVGFNIGTNSSSTVHQEDHVGSNSTSVGHHRNHIGTSNTSNGLQRGHVGTNTSTNVGHQSNNEAMFSISSLLPEMSSESESTGNSTPRGAMQFAGKGKFKAFCPSWRDLKTFLSRVSKRDITDYRWLTNQTCESPAISSISSLKNFIRITEKRLNDENDQLLKSCAKLEHLINTYQGSINRDAGKYEKVAKQLRAAEKRSVSQVEAEINDLLIKMKFLFDDKEVLERKWYNKDGTLLVANSIFKQNLTLGGSQ